MTKKLFTTAVALLLCMGAFAQGVDFRHVSFAEALEQSAAENKPIFLDCFTDWCGPCKHMTENVFPLKEAGDYFNKRFVNIKIDMEKGEGVDIAKRYEIKAYPTFLIIGQDGEVIHRVVGSGSLGDFISRVEAGTNMKKSLETLEGEFASGKISKKDLTQYWLLMRCGGSANRAKSEEVSKKLYGMLSKGDKLKEGYWSLVRGNVTSPLSEGMDFVLANRKALNKSVGAEQVDMVISGAFSNLLNQMIARPVTEEQAANLPAVVAKLNAVDVENKDELLMLARFAEAKAQKDPEKYMELLTGNAGKLSGMNVMTMLNGMNGLIPADDSKAYYARLSDFAAEIAGKSEAGGMGGYLNSIAANYKRRSNVGVYWENFDSLEDAIAQAKAERRPIFLDCYTEWCGPCKHMTNNVFPQEEVGDYFNEKFINIKIDMEKGEGPEVAERFGVRAYPTFVIINPDGSMRHVLVGGGDGPAFIERVKEAFDDNKALGVQAKKFEDGERDMEFLRGYMNTLKKNYNSKGAGEVAQTIFATLSDSEKLSPDNWVLFEDAEMAPAGSDIEKFLLANLDSFRNAIGKEKVDQRIGAPYSRTLAMVVAGRDQNTTVEDIDRMIAEVKSYGLDKPLESALLCYGDVAKLVRKGDRNVRNYKKAAKNVKAEEVPFFSLYPQYKEDLTPAQLKEWKAWGTELAAAMTDPQYKEYMEMVINQE